jgi:hypothetical protein
MGIEALQPGVWKVMDGGEGTGCISGAFSYFVRKGTSNRVVVSFQGGGACWSPETCAESGYHSVSEELKVFNCMASDTALGLMKQSLNVGIMDNNLEGNPVATDTYVFVPYCTQV